MNIKHLTLGYFSPTGSTKRIIQGFPKYTDAPLSDLNLTPQQDVCRRVFDSSEIFILGFPVYGGRVPEVLLKRLTHIKGKDTPVVLLATYGNRDLGDALLEMGNFLHNRGFITIGAIAIVTSHSLVPSLTSDRPDGEDKLLIARFREIMRQKVKDLDLEHPPTPITLPGTFPYKPYKGISIKPIVTGNCRVCGTCVSVCPVGAIPMDSPNISDGDLCISCMACVNACPHHARSLSPINEWGAKIYLKYFSKSRCSSKIYSNT